MKLNVFIIALLVSSGAFSQSKKKQIEILQHQLDSITLVNDSLEKSANRYEQKARFYRKQSEYHESQQKELQSKFDLLVKECDHLEKKGVTKEANTSNTNGSNLTNRGGKSARSFGEDSSEEIVYQQGDVRRRLNNVSVEGIEIKEDAKITYKLTIDSTGNVVAFTCVMGNTTTTDMNLINKIGVSIKEQVKYNKVENSLLLYQFYTIHLKAN